MKICIFQRCRTVPMRRIRSMLRYYKYKTRGTMEPSPPELPEKIVLELESGKDIG